MNYINKIKKTTVIPTTYANRGMGLENDLNLTNQYYLEHNLAVIYKKATPIKVVKVTYSKQKSPLIKEAYFEKPTTTDYNGLYQGKYIDFEAKETKNKLRFPLTNIHQHQINHIKQIIKHGGISFIIVRWHAYKETYLLPSTTLINFIENNKTKAIPYCYFKEQGFLIKEQYQPRLDYLNIVKQYYFNNLI